MKNIIIQETIQSLMTQRGELTQVIADLSPNKADYVERKMTIEGQISNIDFQINSLLVNCDPE